MSADTIRPIVFGALMIHGLGHGGAIGALMLRGVDAAASDRAGWLTAQSQLFPSLTTSTATTAPTVFWILFMVGFVAAAQSFWGIVVPGDAWRLLAVASSIVSLLGITLFIGTQPLFNTIAALTVNAAVLVTQLALNWPGAGGLQQIGPRLTPQRENLRNPRIPVPSEQGRTASGQVRTAPAATGY